MGDKTVHLPSNEIQRVENVRKDFEEEDITVKGYVKSMRNIINPYLTSSQTQAFFILEEEFKNEELTEKGFYKRSKNLLDSLSIFCETQIVTDSSKQRIYSLNNRENNQNIINSSSTFGNEMLRNSNENAGISSTAMNIKTEPEDISESCNGHHRVDVNESSNSYIQENANEVQNDHTQDEVNKLCNGYDLLDIKNTELVLGRKESKNSLWTHPLPSLKRCTICSQLLSSEDLMIYPGHPENAVDEFVALTDPKLSLFTGEENSIHDYDQRPQHKITAFNVYDKEGHLCPFDGGLIEKNVLLYFSGFLKPIYDENPSIEDGIPASEIGPINEWWISGFDGGERALIGFSTPFAEYILMEPSEVYSPFFNAVQEKIYLSKLVIELLIHTIEPSYEDLLLKIQTAVPPQGILSFSEDSLLRHAQFICDQVHNFDLAGEDGEERFILSPCIRSLINLAGVTLGKRRTTQLRVRKKIDMPKFTKATTTPLVMNLFESFFADQIGEQKKSLTVRRARCGVCEVCQEPDCGNCRNCKDMVKFGGSGRSKQCCVNRRCPNMAVMEREESDGEEDFEDFSTDRLSNDKSTRSHRIKKRVRNIEWVGEPQAVEGKKSYYMEVKVEGEIIKLGDCVMVEPDNPQIPVYIARVESLWELKTGKGEKFFHADWFCRGSDTILGETADPQELFLINDCEDSLLEAVLRKVMVIEYTPPTNWKELGGNEESDPIEERNDHTFFYQKWYNPELGRFEDIPPLRKDIECYKSCQSCLRIKEEESNEMCLLGEKLEKTENTLNQYSYKSLTFYKQEYEVGDCCYVLPEAFKFKVKCYPPSVENKKPLVDENMYPEFYRKTSDKVKGSNVDTPEPFRIVRILKIMCSSSDSSLVSPEDVKFRVSKFYRPENTHKGVNSSYQADLNLLYWSEEEATVFLSSVCGKCTVIYAENIQSSSDEHFLGGPNRFKFLKAYDPNKMEFYEPPMDAQLRGSVGKGKGQGKGKVKSKSSKKEFLMETYPSLSNRLNTLDVFAGCGGLSNGMHEAGLSEPKWAVEVYEPAAQAFRINNPNAVVFTDDCNILLKLVMEGKTVNDKGQKLPQKGEVDMLCGGPPCQGFSGMNRFNSRQYSQFKNSLVASFLSYCDYYRPKYFLLENVRNFVSYKCSMVLKLTLRVLIKMGYQCTVGVLQAGNYGVPQTRRRAIILAAAPGEVLPFFPEPITTFSPRASQLSIAVDDNKKFKYSSNCRWTSSAPLRTVTVRDALFDLPEIGNGARKDQINYGTEPESHFQRLIRGKQYQPLLRDHICKDMAPLVESRMKHIPTAPGSDWRDLPNISILLSDGKYSKVLVYTHHDKKNGRSSTGSLRGVCSCASGNPCDPMDRQFNTLIPWCLPHTGNRHNHWSGLYGRLEWDGFFSTTVTNPEPMGKQGRVLHPEQHRVVSVRECARSQGFSDTYRFHGSLLEKHRQIGNAVPPPMAKSIGYEIIKAIKLNEMKENGIQVHDSKANGLQAHY
ncbi:DNA (cytosine-5)-methyltransferase PliMCI [Armadillidium nasatum]|uniref:DNA (cytosine-5)-methyltransferase n=1 Tax=Armadillidium nasatum TaxID=96803 RepID=A0A5N5TDP0_9CRUS|nr:DNA (cytosine-5)-methyltransferase PliMCI [Armadillidium nasatum]